MEVRPRRESASAIRFRRSIKSGSEHHRNQVSRRSVLVGTVDMIRRLLLLLIRHVAVAVGRMLLGSFRRLISLRLSYVPLKPDNPCLLLLRLTLLELDSTLPSRLFPKVLLARLDNLQKLQHVSDGFSRQRFQDHRLLYTLRLHTHPRPTGSRSWSCKGTSIKLFWCPRRELDRLHPHLTSKSLGGLDQRVAHLLSPVFSTIRKHGLSLRVSLAPRTTLKTLQRSSVSFKQHRCQVHLLPHLRHPRPQLTRQGTESQS